jgi:hypothetical protein
MKQTLAEYLAQGGKITKCPPISEDVREAMDRALEAVEREKHKVIPLKRNNPKLKRVRK